MGVAAPASAAQEPETVTNRWCPVMPQEPAQARFRAEHEGQAVYFCCARCLTRFQNDPDPYLPVLASMPLQADHLDDAASGQHDGHDHHHGQVPALLGWLGKFHPAAAHFPVAMLIAAAIAELLRMLLGKVWLRDATRFCIWTGALGALVAAPLGWFNAGWDIAHDDWILGTHRWLGTLTMFWSIGLVVMVELTQRRRTAGRQRLYLLVLMLGAILVATVGHFGGMLVFGPEYYLW